MEKKKTENGRIPLYMVLNSATYERAGVSVYHKHQF